MSTIREVAKLAGVSAATVSRVLNNDATYKMRNETRDRVWQAVAQTGYRQRPVAVSAEKDYRPRQNQVGCILSVTAEKYRDPYFMSIYAGIEARLAQKGYSVAFIKTYAELQDPQTLQASFEQPPAGLILMEHLDSKMYRYVRARVPVCVGVDTQHPDIDNVGYDHFEAGLQLARYLIAKGHREIAFVGGSIFKKKGEGSRRYMGFLAAMHMAGLSVRPEWVLDCHWNERECTELVKRLMAGAERPTAICAASDLMAIAALSALYSIGVGVPGQVAVIGLSNIELSQFSSPPLTTYSIPTGEIGRIAVDLVAERLAGCALPPRRVTLPLTRIERSSV